MLRNEKYKSFIICALLIKYCITTPSLGIEECEYDKYLNKFRAIKNVEGQGASKIAFSGSAALIGNTSDVEIKLRFSDDEYFNDSQFMGLVQEDGKLPDQVCLDLKLYKFDSNNFQNGTEVKDLALSTQGIQYYSFIIKGAEIPLRLIQTTNSNNYVYKGYYGLAFYKYLTKELSNTLYFDFTITLTRATGEAVSTAFKPFSLSASSGCIPTGNCTIQTQSQIDWCSDLTCSKLIEVPDLHLNDWFVLRQIVTVPGMAEFYLIDTEVWFTGDGLYRKAYIQQIDNSIVGQVKVLLHAEIIWKNVTIIMNSVLAYKANGTRRLLTQTTFDTITGSTDELNCIKVKGSDTCANCQQECFINGYASDGCDFCISVSITASALQFFSPFLILLSF